MNKKKVFSILLVLSMAIAILPGAAPAIYAADENSSYDIAKGSIIRFGIKNGEGVAWRVVDSEHTLTGGNGMLLISKNTLNPRVSSSGLATKCTNVQNEIFKGKESDLILQQSKERGSDSYDINFRNDALSYAKLCTPSLEEIFNTSYFANNEDRKADNAYFLRSYSTTLPGQFYARVTDAGTTDIYSIKYIDDYPIRPFTNFNKNDIYLSLPYGFKADGTIKSVPEYTEHRLVIKDSELSDFTALARKIDGRNIRIEYGAAGKDATGTYESGAKYTETSYISILIRDASGKPKYYGNIKTVGTATGGYVDFTLPDRADTATDSLYVFNERIDESINGMGTTFASPLIKVCISHDFEYENVSAAKHKSTCKTCGYTETVEHNFSNFTSADKDNHSRTCAECGYIEKASHNIKYVADGSGHHNRVCETCGLNELQDCEITHTSKSDNEHLTKCKYCSYNYTEKHTLSYEMIDSEEHTRTCGVCGYTANVKHEFDEYIRTKSGHMGKCKDCEYIAEMEAHDYAYSNYNNGNEHKMECNICGYITSEPHTYYSYTSIDENSHNAKCIYCTKILSESHNKKYTDNGAETHTVDCETCGYTETAQHSFEYRANDDSSKTAVCENCGHIGVTAFANADIPQGLRDITQYVDKDSVTTPNGVWSNGSVKNLFEDSKEKFGGDGSYTDDNNVGLTADFNTDRSINVKGIQIWTGNDSEYNSSRNPEDFEIYGKENADDTEYTKITAFPTTNMEAKSHQPYTYILDTYAPYKYYRVIFKKYNSLGIQADRLALLGSATTPVSYNLSYVAYSGDDGTAEGELFMCTLYSKGGHPAADKVSVMLDNERFSDYTYDAATGILTIANENVKAGTYSVFAAGETYEANVIYNTSKIQHSGASTANINSDYTSVLSDSAGGTDFLPESIEVAIGGNILEQSQYTYDKESGKLIIPAKLILDDITITAKEIYGIYFMNMEEVLTEDCVSGDFGENTGGTWEFDSRKFEFSFKGMHGADENTPLDIGQMPLVMYDNGESTKEISLKFEDCKLTTDIYILLATAKSKITFTGKNELESRMTMAIYAEPAQISVSGTTTIKAFEQVLAGPSKITGSGRLITESLNEYVFGQTVIYGKATANKRYLTKKSYVEYNNGEMTEGKNDIIYAAASDESDSKYLVRNGEVQQDIIDTIFGDKSQYIEFASDYIKFKGGAYINNLALNICGDVKVIFEGNNSLECVEPFNSIQGSLTFEAAEGSYSRVVSKNGSVASCDETVYFTGKGKISLKAEKGAKAVSAQKAMCGNAEISRDIFKKSELLYDGSAENPISGSNPIMSISVRVDNKYYDILNGDTLTGVEYDSNTNTLTISDAAQNISNIDFEGDLNIVLDNASVKQIYMRGHALLNITLKGKNTIGNINAYDVAFTTVDGAAAELEAYSGNNVLSNINSFTVDGKTITKLTGKKGYISYGNAAFWSDISTVMVGDVNLVEFIGTTLEDNKKYGFRYDDTIGILSCALEKAEIIIERVVEENNERYMRITLNNANIINADNYGIYCNDDLEIILNGKNTISKTVKPRVSAPPAHSSSNRIPVKTTSAEEVSVSKLKAEPTSAKYDISVQDTESSGAEYKGTAIYSAGNLKISGGGTLEVVAKNNNGFETGVYASTGNLTISDAELNIETERYALYAENKQTIENSKLKISSSDTAVYAGEDILFNEVTADIENMNKDSAAIISTASNITICGDTGNINIRSNNVGMYASSGKISFEGGNIQIAGESTVEAKEIELCNGMRFLKGTTPADSKIIKPDTINSNTCYIGSPSDYEAYATKVVIGKEAGEQSPTVELKYNGSAINVSADGGGKYCVLMLAAYNGGKLVDVRKIELKTDDNSVSDSVENLGLNIRYADEVRAMLWDGSDGITPVYPTQSVKLDGAYVKLTENSDGITKLSADGNGRTGVLTVASYRNNGSVIDVKKLELTKKENAADITLETLGLNTSNAKEIRAMLWENEQSAIPLCPADKVIK